MLLNYIWILEGGGVARISEVVNVSAAVTMMVYSRWLTLLIMLYTFLLLWLTIELHTAFLDQIFPYTQKNKFCEIVKTWNDF